MTTCGQNKSIVAPSSVDGACLISSNPKCSCCSRRHLYDPTCSKQELAGPWMFGRAILSRREYGQTRPSCERARLDTGSLDSNSNQLRTTRSSMLMCMDVVSTRNFGTAARQGYLKKFCRSTFHSGYWAPGHTAK